MASTTRNAILKALIEGAICELLVKTGSDNVFLQDGTTTLSSKLAEIIASLNTKATKTEVTDAVSAAVSDLPTNDSMNQAISAAIDALIDGAPGTYDTLKEIADYIAQHEDVVNALNSAIGNKADKSTVQTIQATVNALGALAQKSTVAESDLEANLKAKVTEAYGAKHSHSNKTVLDGISADKVTAWDGKGKFYAQASQPASLTANDLWAQLI